MKFIKSLTLLLSFYFLDALDCDTSIYLSVAEDEAKTSSIKLISIEGNTLTKIPAYIIQTHPKSKFNTRSYELNFPAFIRNGTIKIALEATLTDNSTTPIQINITTQECTSKLISLTSPSYYRGTAVYSKKNEMGYTKTNGFHIYKEKLKINLPIYYKK